MSEVSLVERLGYAADTKLLIVNCDDLGSSHAANLAICRSISNGAATSATLMVPCAWAREAARMCEGMPIGVHLTLTAEYPGYRWRSLTGRASLHDDEGFLPASGRAPLERAEVEDVRAECRAQIDQALAWGVDVTHLDAHMGVMQFRREFLDVYLDLAVEYGLPVRMASARFLERQGFGIAETARRRGVLFNEHLVDPWPRRTREVWAAELPKLRPGVNEAFAHPVLDGDELRGYDRENADIRAHDAQWLMDPAARELIRDVGARRINWKPLRELQRAA
jgi:hypothetical protein